MNNGLRHFTTQFVALGRSPLRVVPILGVAGMALLLTAFVSRDDSALSVWMNLLVILYFVGMIVPAAAVRESSTDLREPSRRGRLPAFGLRDWPHPTLPITAATRVAAEALLGLAFFVAWQLAFLVVASVLTTWDLVPTMRFLGLVDVVVLPTFAAGLLPARSQWLHQLRAGATTIAGAAAVWWSIFASSPLPVLLVSVVLTLVLFGTSDVAARIGDRSRCRIGGSAHGALARRRRTPLEQLWRDALLGPIESNRGVLYAAGGAAVAAFVLGLAEGARGIVYGGLILTATVFLGLRLMGSPLGLSPGVESSIRPVDAISGGRWFAGGILLPLRREWVARSFYAHGMVAGIALVGLCLLNAQLKGIPFFGMDIHRGALIAWLPWPLMVPSFAGFLAASAMGDRRLQALSLTAIFLTWPTAVASVAAYDPSASGGMKAWLVLAAALVLALVGGVPPLVYLFPRKRGAIRRP